MSWDIELIDEKGKVCQVDEHSEGGTFVVGGTDEAELNVTYNYGKYFDFRRLNGSVAEDVIKVMETEVVELGIKRNKDYRKPTKGNIGYAVSILLKWARQYPKAIFKVT